MIMAFNVEPIDISIIAQDIIQNNKRFNKIVNEDSVIKRIKLAKNYAIAECARRKIKCTKEDIREVAWKVEDYYRYLWNHNKG